MKWQEIKDNVLRQRSKIDWSRIGDGNNKYFHASIKMRQNFKKMSMLQKDDGTYVTTQHEIGNEVLEFYKKLTGKAENELTDIDTKAMRDGS